MGLIERSAKKIPTCAEEKQFTQSVHYAMISESGVSVSSQAFGAPCRARQDLVVLSGSHDYDSVKNNPPRFDLSSRIHNISLLKNNIY